MKPTETILALAIKLADSHACDLTPDPWDTRRTPEYSLRCNGHEEKRGKLAEIVAFLLSGEPFGYDFRKINATLNEQSAKRHADHTAAQTAMRNALLDANAGKLEAFVMHLYDQSREGHTEAYWRTLWPEDGGGGRFCHWLEDNGHYHGDKMRRDACDHWGEFVSFCGLPTAFVELGC